MTRIEFVNEYRHELDGWILDAAMESRKGAELSIFLRQMRAKIEAKLATMHDALTNERPAVQPVQTNGGRAKASAST